MVGPLDGWMMAEKGDTILITEHGKAVGLIVPMKSSVDSRIKELAQTGLIAWNRRKLRAHFPTAKTRGKRSVADLLLENRE